MIVFLRFGMPVLGYIDVSYPHLDVYKRQGQPFDRSFLKAFSESVFKNNDGFTAVSYTHLDVYKRQPLKQPWLA